MIHELKTIQPYFGRVWEGEKTFEVRKDDRGYAIGDILVMREYNLETETYGRSITSIVLYILRGGQFGIQEGYVAMSIGQVGRYESDEERKRLWEEYGQK